MEHAILSWENIHEFGPLWFEHHKLRKRLFVDELKWQVPHSKLLSVEFDQYDTPETIYVISHIDGKAVAASRLNRTDQRFGNWSYMINDACEGLLPGLAIDLLEEPPKDPKIFEATRFTVDPDLDPATRKKALAENAHALAKAARDLGATKLIALMSPAYTRFLTGIGLDTFRVGPIRPDAENKKVCVMEMPLSA